MKVLCLCLAVLFCFSTLLFAGGQSLSTSVEATPTVVQVTPNGPATVPAARWMQFSNCTGEAACCNTLAGYSNQYKSGVPAATAVDGLQLRNVAIDSAVRADGSILITWTLRVEGKDGSPIDPWHNFCPVWHGSVTETFKGGLVYSQIHVSGATKGYTTFGGSTVGGGYMGKPSSMTVPDGGSGVSSRVSDPTLSGSYLLKPSDFNGGKFPSTITITVYWQNHSALQIISAANYRNLIAAIVPKGK